MTKKLIIAPKSMHKTLIKDESNKNSLYDIKIMTKEQLIDDYFGFFDDKAIIETMLIKDTNYDSAKAMVEVLPFINRESKSDKLNDLLVLKNALISKGFYQVNKYLNVALKDKEITVFSYSPNDYYLNLILKSVDKKNITFIENHNSINGSQITEFASVEQEVHYAMNSIASLISQGKPSDQIFLYGVDETYEDYVKRYAALYNININGFSQKSLLKTGVVRDFLELCYKSGEIKSVMDTYFTPIDSEVDKVDLYNVLQKCLDSRLNFTRQIDVIKSVLKNTYRQNDKYQVAVNIIKDNNGAKDADIFVLGFRQGAFPKIHRDTDYLLESEKEQCSYIKATDINKENIYSLLDFLKSNNRFHYSFSKRSIDENFYPSFIVVEYGFKIVNPAPITNDYSLEAASIELSKMLDMKRKYGEVSPLESSYQKVINLVYATYDNSFSGAEVFNSQSFIKLSYSSVDSFQKCQFKYFLEQCLKVDEFEENFYSKIGLLSHELFKNCLQDGFDFKTSYNNSLSKSVWSDKELTLLVSIQEYLKLACQNIINHQAILEDAKFYLEIPLSFKLDDFTILKGTIDKIIVTKDKNLYIVDYKTGSESFEPKNLEFGFSMQLPTYGLLVKEDERFKDCRVSGLYINHVIDSGIKKTFSDLVTPSYLRLDGQTIGDIKVIEAIDPNYTKEGPRFVNIPNLLKSGEYPKSNKLTGLDSFSEYLKIARAKYEESNALIRQNDFKINPKVIAGKSSCEYCTFKDICYVRKYQQVVLVKLESEEEDEVE